VDDPDLNHPLNKVCGMHLGGGFGWLSTDENLLPQHPLPALYKICHHSMVSQKEVIEKAEVMYYRMSVVARAPDGTIRLYSKGADNVMCSRLRAGVQSGLLESMQDNLRLYSVQVPFPLPEPYPPILSCQLTSALLHS
jgi:hypothetical protein